MKYMAGSIGDGTTGDKIEAVFCFVSFQTGNTYINAITTEITFYEDWVNVVLDRGYNNYVKSFPDARGTYRDGKETAGFDKHCSYWSYYEDRYKDALVVVRFTDSVKRCHICGAHEIIERDEPEEMSPLRDVLWPHRRSNTISKDYARIKAASAAHKLKGNPTLGVGLCVECKPDWNKRDIETLHKRALRCNEASGTSLQMIERLSRRSNHAKIQANLKKPKPSAFFGELNAISKIKELKS